MFNFGLCCLTEKWCLMTSWKLLRSILVLMIWHLWVEYSPNQPVAPACLLLMSNHESLVHILSWSSTPPHYRAQVCALLQLVQIRLCMGWFMIASHAVPCLKQLLTYCLQLSASRNLNDYTHIARYTAVILETICFERLPSHTHTPTHPIYTDFGSRYTLNPCASLYTLYHHPLIVWFNKQCFFNKGNTPNYIN